MEGHSSVVFQKLSSQNRHGPCRGKTGAKQRVVCYCCLEYQFEELQLQVEEMRRAYQKDQSGVCQVLENVLLKVVSEGKVHC